MKNRPQRPTRPSRPRGARSVPPPARGPAPLPRLTIDLYGHHAVRQAILNPERQITAIYAIDDQADMVDEWVKAAQKQGINRPGIHLPPRAAFDAALPREAVHQGVGINCAPLPEVDLADVLRGFEPKLSSPTSKMSQENDRAPIILVMLDQVTDPHNFGAILRSAAAFGATGVIVQRRHTPEINGLIAKTACGAVDVIPVMYETNLSRSIELCKENAFTVLGLDERGVVLGDNCHPGVGRDPMGSGGPRPTPGRQDRILLVLGAEGAGLRRLVREGCDQLVALPTVAPILSLNVSNAAAVALYALKVSGRI